MKPPTKQGGGAAGLKRGSWGAHQGCAVGSHRELSQGLSDRGLKVDSARASPEAETSREWPGFGEIRNTF